MSTLPIGMLDANEAHYCARQSALAYLERGRPLVSRVGGTVYVAIKGTDGWREWLNNTRLGLVRFERSPTVKVHAGFHDMYLGCLDAVMLAMTREHGYHAIVFCGHSLGGAVAALLATGLAPLYRDIDVRLYQFGAPRPGNDYFRMLCVTRLPSNWTCLLDMDVVPHLISGRFYDRVGSKVWLRQDGQMMGRVRGGLATALLWAQSFRRDDLGDHSFDEYEHVLSLFAARQRPQEGLAL